MSPKSSPAASTSKRDSEPDLFFPASDEEDADDDIVIDHAPSASRRSSPPAPPSSKPTATAAAAEVDAPLFMASQESDIVALDPAPKLQRTSSLTVPSTAGPSRKRPSPSRTPSSAVPAGFTGGYLGEFVCEGWSLSKGKGYCSAGSRIVFERPKAAKGADDDKRLAERNEKKLGPAKLVNGKMVHAKGKTAGKQMTIGSMLKKSSPAPTTAKKIEKKQVDQIIRFRNDRGFEVGRLSVNEAGFLVHLLDTDVSEYPRPPISRCSADGKVSLGGTVIDCPPVLSTGATILLNVKVYLTRKAFETVEKTDRQGQGTFWQEQQETEAEEAMRRRKDALGSLFSESSTRSGLT